MLKRRIRRKLYVIGSVLVVAFILAVATAGAWGHGRAHGCPWWAWWC